MTTTAWVGQATVRVRTDLQIQEAKVAVLEDWLVPRLSPPTLLLLAALCWLVVGAALVVKGGEILAWRPPWMVATLVVGMVKAHFILDRIARRNVQRLQSYRHNLFVGRMFAGRTWLVIMVMIGLGRLLRLPGVAPELSGFFSLAVGWGLFIASRLSWLAWLRARQDKRYE